MKSIIIQFLILLVLLSACKDKNRARKSYDESYNESSENDETSEEQVEGNQDGRYCSEVEYYNPNTGTRNTYDLDVEVENGYLTEIHWPNGGWLDQSHFSSTDISDGDCEFTSDRGYKYTVTLKELGGCGYTDESKLRSDVNEDVEKTTCPECGEEKDTYDDYCDDCKRKKENTCPKCGGYKYSSFDEVCDNCKEEDQDNQ